jgi:uncharacterized protein (TIGR02678 family)
MIASDRLAARQQSAQAELQKAHVALLDHDCLTVNDREIFRLVSNYYRVLQVWHEQHTGWRILRLPTVIRLLRSFAHLPATFIHEPMREPRDFACLAWTLWYAEFRHQHGRGDTSQFLISDLAEKIQQQSTTSSNPLDFRKQADRFSIQRALRYLEQLGYLRIVDGVARGWINQEQDADVLYEFTDAVRSLIAAIDPRWNDEIIARLSQDIAQPQPIILPAAEKIAPLERAWRALLLGPALFRFDDPVAFAALIADTDRFGDELAEIFGWLCTVTPDYACIVRPAGSTQGPVNTFATTGAIYQIILLLCNELRQLVHTPQGPRPDTFGCLLLRREDLAANFYRLRERFETMWGRDIRSRQSDSVLNEVMLHMRRLGLLRGPDALGQLLITPLAARYSALYEDE